MITLEEAYAINPATGQIDMNKFRQFAAQQEAALNNMRATTVLAPAQQYMQANPDVLGHATRTAAAEGIAPGANFGARTQEVAARHFADAGASEGREGFGLPLSNFTPPPINYIEDFEPVQPEPIPDTTVTAPVTTFDETTGQEVQINLTGPSNYPPAPLPSQLPGYSFTGNPDFYADALGTMGGLLGDTTAYYAGQIPAAPTMQPGGSMYPNANYAGQVPAASGYNFPELARYPNANYASGAFPFIFTY